MSGIAVRVLKPCTLADPDFRALPPSNPGDVVTIAGGWYVESVMGAGLVGHLDDPTVGVMRDEIEDLLASIDEVETKFHELELLDQDAEKQATPVADAIKQSQPRSGKRATKQLN